MNAADAAIAAFHAHADQLDKGGLPYIFHPLAVSRAVAGLGEDFEVVALLHDVWEDTDYQLTGLSVQQERALDAITQRKGEQGKEGYFDYIRRCRENFIARVVKVADLQHNLSPERMDALSERQAASLRVRYRQALTIVTASQ